MNDQRERDATKHYNNVLRELPYESFLWEKSFQITCKNSALNGWLDDEPLPSEIRGEVSPRARGMRGAGEGEGGRYKLDFG